MARTNKKSMKTPDAVDEGYKREVVFLNSRIYEISSLDELVEVLRRLKNEKNWRSALHQLRLIRSLSDPDERKRQVANLQRTLVKHGYSMSTSLIEQLLQFK